jgi:DNA-binding XRE family transcriptional regulator
MQHTTLKDYLQETGAKQADVARQIGVSKGYMSLLAKELRAPSLKIAMAIERVTEGRVPASIWGRV